MKNGLFYHHLFTSAALCCCVLGCSDSSSDESEPSVVGTPGVGTPENTTGAVENVSFLNLRAEEIEAASAVVKFETSLATTGAVEYGLLSDQLDSLATGTSMGASPYAVDHAVPLAGLLPAITYHYRARATTPGGQDFYSEVSNFSTSALGPIAGDPVNVAQLGAGAVVVSSSSNWGGAANDKLWGANSAIDGDLSTEWATNGDGDAAQLTIDLGQVRAIVGVGYRGREMSDGSSIVTSMQVVFDGEIIAGPFATPDPSQLYAFDLPESITTRTARFEAVTSTGGNTGAREVRLFAIPYD